MIFFIELFKFLVRKIAKNENVPAELTWHAPVDVATGPGGADVASEPTWRAGPPRRCDVALRPRGRTRVARAQEARQVAGRPRGRPCGAPRVAEYRGHNMIVNRGDFSPI